MKSVPQAKRRIALASYHLRKLQMQQRYLCTMSHTAEIRLFQRGSSLLAELAQGAPCDLILLEDELLDMTAVDFLEQLHRLGLTRCPNVVLMAESELLPRTGGQELLFGPVELPVLMQSIDLLEEEHTRRLRSCCRALCRQLGVPAGSCGLDYLQEAVLAAAQSGERRAVRKELLQPVAQRFHLSVPGVESGIRRVLSDLEAGNTPLWQEFCSRYGQGSRFSVGRFLYAMREQVLSRLAVDEEMEGRDDHEWDEHREQQCGF